MTAEKTTLLPVSPDEAFALVTEPGDSAVGGPCPPASTSLPAVTTAGPSYPATWPPAPSARWSRAGA